MISIVIGVIILNPIYGYSLDLTESPGGHPVEELHFQNARKGLEKSIVGIIRTRSDGSRCGFLEDQLLWPSSLEEVRLL